MPRIKTGVEAPAHGTNADLVDRLAEELKSGHESGQPIIYEREYSPGLLVVTVVWDKWDRLPLEERTEVILRAYEQAEGRSARERVALASGLTFPEACNAGLLPFRIVMALRQSDPLTPEQCRQAMIEEGASRLLEPNDPQLRFQKREEAEAAQRRLVRRLPQSDGVWVIITETSGLAYESEG